jgi:hypothetical protein
MTPDLYAERLDALSAYVEAREAEIASPSLATMSEADIAYEWYAAISEPEATEPEPEAEL